MDIRGIIPPVATPMLPNEDLDLPRLKWFLDHLIGCGVHGDAIRWLTDARGLPFMDAVKELAEAAGMEVPAADA